MLQQAKSSLYVRTLSCPGANNSGLHRKLLDRTQSPPSPTQPRNFLASQGKSEGRRTRPGSDSAMIILLLLCMPFTFDRHYHQRLQELLLYTSCIDTFETALSCTKGVLYESLYLQKQLCLRCTAQCRSSIAVQSWYHLLSIKDHR